MAAARTVLADPIGRSGPDVEIIGAVGAGFRHFAISSANGTKARMVR